VQLNEFIAQKHGGKLVVGDTVLWSEMIWTVAELQDGDISRVGVRPVTPAGADTLFDAAS
jgi:cell volume regulation protein A